MRKPFARLIATAAVALAAMVAMPFTASADGYKCLGMTEAEIVFIGAVLDAADAAYDLNDEPMPVPAHVRAQEREAIGEQIEWTARYEATFGMMDRGAAQGVGVPSEAERPPAVV